MEKNKALSLNPQPTANNGTRYALGIFYVFRSWVLKRIIFTGILLRGSYLGILFVEGFKGHPRARAKVGGAMAASSACHGRVGLDGFGGGSPRRPESPKP